MNCHIRWVDEAASTNSLLASEASCLGHGAVVAVRKQTAGRGQRGNSWESEPDANLTFSMLLRPRTIRAASQFELSMLVSLGVCIALEEASGEKFRVKWPNDIYHGDHKICGILIENSLDGFRIGRSIAGIGINVNQTVFVSDAPNPISLANITGCAYDLETLLEKVCGTILALFDGYEDDPEPADLVARYKANLWRGNGFYQWLDAATATNFEAEILDVATDGMLTLRERSGCLRTYAFKEVSAVI